METLHAELKPKAAPQSGEAAGLRLVFKGRPLKHLLGSGRKQPSGPWRQGGSEQQDGDWPSPGEAAALTDSPGRPFSLSSAEASPDVPPGAPGGAVPGPRSVRGQPPGKAPYPDDRTPEAEAVRAQSQPPAAGAAAGAAPAAPAAPAAAVAAAAPAAAQPTAAMADAGGDPATAGPRSVHGQPPGKGVHPDDPAYRGPVPTDPDRPHSQQNPHSASAAQGSGGEMEGGDGSTGPRSVYGQPPGKNAAQIQQIAAASTHVEEPDEDEEPLSPLSAGGPPPTAPWQQPQQVAAVAAPGQGYAPSQATSGHVVRQRAAPPMAGGSGGTPAEQPASRKRPASQAAGDTGQRKRAANGAAGSGDGQTGGLQRLPTAVSSSHGGGVPASLARSSSFHGGQGPATAVQQIRPMPGAPRSLQQRQQLANGAAGSTAGPARQPAGAPRARQPPAPAKPKQPAKPSGSGQRRPSSAQGAAAAAAAVAHQYKPGDIVWAKIGVYPWWPAQLQRPTADEHFKPKHASTDLFCVFYGSNDYNWLPPNQIKPFIETHPDYQRHAAVKNKALQRAIDEAWVYGMQRQRPDSTWTGARFVA